MSNTAEYGKTKRRIYMDCAATTPLDEEVFEAMKPYFGSDFGNPSSIHSSGRTAKRAIENARLKTAEIIGAKSREIIFTGSGTESDNLAIIGAARANRERGNHIIISAVEHKAVIEAAKQLEREGFRADKAPVDSFGRVNADEILSLVKNDTILVSVMYANNETGMVMPVAEIGEKLKKIRGQNKFPLFHTDACQAAGWLPLNVSELNVDLMTLNGSKIYGPKGVGVLYKKRDILLEPIIVGGGQESGLRAGTESVPLIVGFAAALEKAERLRQNESAHLRSLREYFIEELKKRIPEIIINGHPEFNLPTIVYATFPKIEGESLVLMLDEAGVEAATGSACSSNNLEPSYVLRAMGQSDDLIHGSVRFSLSRHTTREEIDYVLSVLPRIVQQLKSVSFLTTKVCKSDERKTAKANM